MIRVCVVNDINLSSYIIYSRCYRNPCVFLLNKPKITAQCTSEIPRNL